MNAGRLDRRIEIQERTQSRGNHGDPIYTWATFCIPWANVAEGDGNEVVEADKKAAVMTTIFTIRYRSDIRNSMRILHDSQYYNIEGVSEIIRRMYLKITARVTKA